MHLPAFAHPDAAIWWASAVVALLVCSLFIWRCARRAGGRGDDGWSRAEQAEDIESFYSAESDHLAECLLHPPLVPHVGSDLSRAELVAVEKIVDELKDAKPPEDLLLQVAYSRGLDPPSATALWRRHLRAVERLRIAGISDASVRQAYSSGFCVRSGRDVDGRPMCWVRLALCEPSRYSPALIVRNTWLAQDALLRGDPDLTRCGLCFVYDLQGVGLRNVSFDPIAVGSSIWGATSHPSHIARVWLLDAPRVFLAAWAAGKHFVPEVVRETVRFGSTGDRDRPTCFASICAEGELPVYLGGDASRFGGEFADWMFQQLEGADLAYRPAKAAAPQGYADQS